MCYKIWLDQLYCIPYPFQWTDWPIIQLSMVIVYKFWLYSIITDWTSYAASFLYNYISINLIHVVNSILIDVHCITIQFIYSILRYSIVQIFAESLFLYAIYAYLILTPFYLIIKYQQNMLHKHPYYWFCTQYIW